MTSVLDHFLKFGYFFFKRTVSPEKMSIFQVAEMESLRMQLQRVEERSEERNNEVERLRNEAVELLADMAACRRKEAQLLEFTQKLTDKNVNLQVSSDRIYIVTGSSKNLLWP
jgi:hypothetical protein